MTKKQTSPAMTEAQCETYVTPTMCAALVTVAGLNADGAFNDTENTIRAALDLAEGGAA